MHDEASPVVPTTCNTKLENFEGKFLNLGKRTFGPLGNPPEAQWAENPGMTLLSQLSWCGLRTDVPRYYVLALKQAQPNRLQLTDPFTAIDPELGLGKSAQATVWKFSWCYQG